MPCRQSLLMLILSYAAFHASFALFAMPAAAADTLMPLRRRCHFSMLLSLTDAPLTPCRYAQRYVVITP